MKSNMQAASPDSLPFFQVGSNGRFNFRPLSLFTSIGEKNSVRKFGTKRKTSDDACAAAPFARSVFQ